MAAISYQLVDKLGYGGYSTIWLARDLQSARYVALKVIIADASDCTPEGSHSTFAWELAIQTGERDHIIPRRILDHWSQWEAQMYRDLARADELV